MSGSTDHAFTTDAASGSDLPLVAHSVRRLGIGPHADLALAAASVDEAIAAALDLTEPPAPLPNFPAPMDMNEARQRGGMQIVLGHWIEQMTRSPRLIEERLVWFWHDHFATSMRKVRIAYLMHLQHATVREHATGRFDLLLGAIARDPAMLVYLDGRNNRAGAINENFAREVMELHTMGRGNYTQEDVVAAARAFSGWVMVPPGEHERRPNVEPWTAVLVPNRHDDGEKTLLGVTARLDMDSALDLILSQPATAETVASKLFRELVGLDPDPDTARRLGRDFRRDYEIMPLVEAIAADPHFLSQESMWSRVRTPVERLAGIAQGFPTHDEAARHAGAILDAMGYVPMFPPNPAGFPDGSRLLGPYQLVHTLDFGALVGPRPPEMGAEEILARLGIFEASEQTRSVVHGAPDTAAAIALAAASPEYALN